MWTRHLGFVFLIWFPGVLHAQSGEQTCDGPELHHGYYSQVDEKHLSYSCDNGYKPAAEGWWAISTCQNGTWTPEPQCIDENACIPPTIPNAVLTTQAVWYNKGTTIRTKCDKGYDHKNRVATAKCENGTWSSLPVCEKSIHTCGEPPKIPHAVKVDQGYQNVFAVDSKVTYECEDGYTTEGGDTRKEITCVSGQWDAAPQCRSPSSSGRNPPFIPIENCGRPPNVPNSDVVEKERMFLKYQCSSFYTLVGSDTVKCYSDGSWSPLPTCDDAFCKLDPGQYPQYNWKRGIGVQYVKEGETKNIPCIWSDWSVPVRCADRKITLIHRCCHHYDINRGYC